MATKRDVRGRFVAGPKKADASLRGRKGLRGILLRIGGTRAIDRRLRKLPTAVARKVLNKAVRAGLKPIHAEARQLCPVDTGALRDSIKVRAWAKRKRGQVAMEVRTGEGDFQGETFYGPMVEFGHFAGPRALGNARTWVQPHPFMRPAYDAKKREARQIAMDAIRRGIDRVVTLLARGAKVSARDL